MFCPNCGEKIDDNALFCGECGTKIETEEKPKKVKSKKAVHKTRSEKKPAKEKTGSQKFNPKAKKIITVQVVILVVLVGMFYYFGSKSEEPDQVVNQFMKNYNNKNWSDVYELYHFEESTFINKDSFVKTMNQSSEELLSQPVLYSTQGNQIIYSLNRGNSSILVTVAKSTQKSYLFFSKYEITNISDSSLITNSTRLPVIPGVTLKIDGIKEERPSDETGSTYLVTMFKGTHKVTFEGADGIFTKDEYSFDTTKDNLLTELEYSEASKVSAANAVKSYLPAITETKIKNTGNAGLTSYFSSADQANTYGTALCRYTYGTGSDTKSLGNINVTKCEAVTGNSYKTIADGIPILVTGSRDYQYKLWNSYEKSTCQVSGIAYMIRKDGKWVIDTVSYYY